MEAQQRGLPNIRKSFHSFAQIIDKRTHRVFEGILSEAELYSRYEILIERYAKTMEIEANLMVELFRTQILPAALIDQKQRTQSMKNLSDLGIRPTTSLLGRIEIFANAIEAASFAVDEIEKTQNQSADFHWEAKAKTYCEILGPKMEEARQAVDRLEQIVDNALWPLPKYWEMLFII